MTDNASRAKDEELRIELLQTIFKFKKLANSGLGMKLVDGKQDISLAEFMLLRAIEEGFISRTLPRENRRSTLVLLTPKGRELLGDEKSEFNMKLDALIAAMGHEDIEELIRIVEKLTKTLERPQFKG